MTALADLAPVWTTARASGMAALLCSSLALAAGLLMALRPITLRGQKLELRAAHEALALATFALLVVHGVSLFLDPVLKPGVTGVLVPFGSDYARLGAGLGQIAAYGMVGLGLTFYARRRLGSQRWRQAHRAIPIFWAMAVGHAALTGTDAFAWWFLLSIAPPVLAGLALLGRRHLAAAGSPAQLPSSSCGHLRMAQQGLERSVPLWDGSSHTSSGAPSTGGCGGANPPFNS